MLETQELLKALLHIASLWRVEATSLDAGLDTVDVLGWKV
jgi:hypothetical protein